MKKVLLIFILSQFYLCCIGRNSDTISVLNDFKGTWVITKNYYEINRPAAYLLTKKEQKERIGRKIIITPNEIKLFNNIKCTDFSSVYREDTWRKFYHPTSSNRYYNPIKRYNPFSKIKILDTYCKHSLDKLKTPTSFHEPLILLIKFSDGRIFLVEGSSYFRLRRVLNKRK